MKKNYVIPQVVNVEVPIEGEVFAGSPTVNTFGDSADVGTDNLSSPSQSSGNSFSLTGASSQEEAELRGFFQ